MTDMAAIRERNRKVYAAIEYLPPLAAVDYLLGVIDSMEQFFSEAETLIDTWGLTLTPLEHRILTLLVSRAGSVVSHEAIYDAMYSERVDFDGRPGGKIVQVKICQLRPKIPESIGKIKTVWGFGYKFEVAA